MKKTFYILLYLVGGITLGSCKKYLDTSLGLMRRRMIKISNLVIQTLSGPLLGIYLLGMFTLPAYGGNRAGVGWKLIGFEDTHAFYPPFGYYDRDYPGFVIDLAHIK